MTEHKYAEILRAIADGKTIQGATGDANWPEGWEWADLDTTVVLRKVDGVYSQPEWFRVKPEKVYPVTSYTVGELCSIWVDGCEEGMEKILLELANKVLKRYIDEQEG